MSDTDAATAIYTAMGEQQSAAAYISMFAEHLTVGSHALKVAAERLKKRDDSYGANQAYQVHLRLRQAAQELVGTE